MCTSIVNTWRYYYLHHKLSKVHINPVPSNMKKNPIQQKKNKHEKQLKFALPRKANQCNVWHKIFIFKSAVINDILQTNIQYVYFYESICYTNSLYVSFLCSLFNTRIIFENTSTTFTCKKVKPGLRSQYNNWHWVLLI